jgi:hypothetical protein
MHVGGAELMEEGRGGGESGGVKGVGNACRGGASSGQSHLAIMYHNSVGGGELHHRGPQVSREPGADRARVIYTGYY